MGKKIAQQVVVCTWSLEPALDRGDVAQGVLSLEEQIRAKRYLDPRHRDRFIASRLGLRTILGTHLAQDAKSLVFVENEFGKPHVADQPLHFSLSHSEDRAILAISDSLEVGVDLERIRPLDHLDLAARYFCASELAMIESLPAAKQLSAFYQIWTVKEAIVKALGVGLSIPLDEFEVSIATSPPRLVVSPNNALPPDHWELKFLAPAADYQCALAIPAAGWPIELIQRTC